MGAFIQSCPFFIWHLGYTSINTNAARTYGLCAKKKVYEIFSIEPDDIYSKSRQKTRAEARGLFCYWAVVELGYSLADLSKLLGMTGQGVGYAVRRGERNVKATNYKLID